MSHRNPAPPWLWILPIALFATWILLQVAPRLLFWAGVLIYVAFFTAVGASAVRHRREGWIAGLLLAVLLGTLPGWVLALNQFFAASVAR